MAAPLAAFVALCSSLVAQAAMAPRATSHRLTAPIPDDCETACFTQRLDHFRFTPSADASQPTFAQRYVVCRGALAPPGGAGSPPAPILFYAGNEAPLEGYMHNTGLMFENRAALGALVLFAEHRYYGDTQPFGPHSWKVDPSYLSMDQALADYAVLLANLTAEWGMADSPVIAFGGSYGGMLAALLRRLYPHLVAGAVAASAPMGAFPGVPGFEPSKFWDVVTRDATPAGGAAADCADNVRQGFRQLLAAGASAQGRAALAAEFATCEPLADEAGAMRLAYWVQGAFDAYAMGNYHFASDYMTDGGVLPAWPMRAACEAMSSLQPAARAVPLAAQRARVASGREQAAARGGLLPDLLPRLRRAASLLYNASGDKPCFSLELAGPAAGEHGPWDWQVCTQVMGQELPYFPAAASSMFWDQGQFDWVGLQAHCRKAWGVQPDGHWAAAAYGGLDWSAASNIVFSNGLLDPWSAFGLLQDASDSVVAVVIEDGAHHSDLMYARPDDSEALKQARRVIIAHVAAWVQGAQRSRAQAHARRGGDAAAAAAAA